MMHARIQKQSVDARSILQPFYPRALTGKAFHLAGRQSIYQISIPARQRDIHQYFLPPFIPFTLHQHAREFLITFETIHPSLKYCSSFHRCHKIRNRITKK